MKPYCNLNGKAAWNLFWGDKTKAKHKMVFKKSARQKLKQDLDCLYQKYEQSWDESNEQRAELHDEQGYTSIL
jgi:hypothetical protein